MPSYALFYENTFHGRQPKIDYIFTDYFRRWHEKASEDYLQDSKRSGCIIDGIIVGTPPEGQATYPALTAIPMRFGIGQYPFYMIPQLAGPPPFPGRKWLVGVDAKIPYEVAEKPIAEWKADPEFTIAHTKELVLRLRKTIWVPDGNPNRIAGFALDFAQDESVTQDGAGEEEESEQTVKVTRPEEWGSGDYEEEPSKGCDDEVAGGGVVNDGK